MGFKRPFDDEKLHELPFKHSRPLGYSDKSNQFEEFLPRDAVSQKYVAPVNEGDFCEPQEGESSSGETFDGLNMDGSFTWFTKDFELGLPSRISPHVETLYSFLLDQPARKKVPIGPCHQANIPEWECTQIGHLEPSGTSVQKHITVCADGEMMYGTCVIPMPDLKTPEHVDEIVGKGRELCVCEDRDSISCVRQHVKEAREEMVKMLGFEKFRDLGFCDMGEEVAQKWNDEDELLFHEIVYSNPVTLGQNFWHHLEAAFCSRTKNEIVSYYFNVFVLRRRATQNRNLILDIDSDDDEWHVSYGGSFGYQYVEEDEEDSAIESPLQQGTEKFNEKVHPLHQEEGASISNNDEDVDNRESGNGPCNEMNATVDYMDESNEQRLNMEDDSCTAFELANDAVKSGLTNFAKKD
ncbi:unnamed protein product [Cochlearia groenlandica]